MSFTLYDVIYAPDNYIRGKFRDSNSIPVEDLKALYITFLKKSNQLDQNSEDITNDRNFWEWYFKPTEEVYDKVKSYGINPGRISLLDAILIIISPQNNITMRLIGKSIADNNRILEIYKSTNLTDLNRLILLKQLEVGVRLDLIRTILALQ